MFISIYDRIVPIPGLLSQFRSCGNSIDECLSPLQLVLAPYHKSVLVLFFAVFVFCTSNYHNKHLFWFSKYRSSFKSATKYRSSFKSATKYRSSFKSATKYRSSFKSATRLIYQASLSSMVVLGGPQPSRLKF